jgi:hypothetical protein
MTERKSTRESPRLPNFLEMMKRLDDEYQRDYNAVRKGKSRGYISPKEMLLQE